MSLYEPETKIFYKGGFAMKLREEILVMFYEENLTLGEIAGALHQDPHYVYEVVYGLR